MEHRLKTWSSYYDAVNTGAKSFELRVNDRNFQVGDTIVLEEYNPETTSYTGRSLTRTIGYILERPPFGGLEVGWVILGIV